MGLCLPSPRALPSPLPPHVSRRSAQQRFASSLVRTKTWEDPEAPPGLRGECAGLISKGEGVVFSLFCLPFTRMKLAFCLMVKFLMLTAAIFVSVRTVFGGNKQIQNYIGWIPRFIFFLIHSLPDPGHWMTGPMSAVHLVVTQWPHLLSPCGFPLQWVASMIALGGDVYSAWGLCGENAGGSHKEMTLKCLSRSLPLSPMARNRHMATPNCKRPGNGRVPHG